MSADTIAVGGEADGGASNHENAAFARRVVQSSVFKLSAAALSSEAPSTKSVLDKHN